MNALKQSILKSLYFNKMQSVADLSAATSKSIPNVTKVVNELLRGQVIVQEGYALSTGGRRPLQFRLNTESLPAVLAVAIDQYYTSIAIYDLSNTLLSPIKTWRIPLEAKNEAYESILRFIKETIDSFSERSFFSIGITMPGFVDAGKGFNNSYSEEDKLYQIRGLVEKEFGIPTVIENDSTAIAIAEKNFGQANKSKDVLVINLNWGVGLGMIIDNKLFKGHSGYAGEFSHIPLSDTSKLCSCGKKGCLEVEASLLSAIEYVTERLTQGENSALSKVFVKQGYVSGEQLVDAALRGDQLAIESINNIAFMLGKGIATLIHIINPEYVLVSGRGAKVGHILLPQIQSGLLKYSIQRLSQHTTVLISDIDHVQLLGSVCVAVERTDWAFARKLENLLTN